VALTHHGLFPSFDFVRSPRQKKRKRRIVVYSFSFSFTYIWRTISPGRDASNAEIVRPSLSFSPFLSPLHLPSSLLGVASCAPQAGQADTNVPFFKSTIVGHIAETCTSQERLCYNCRKPGHESSTCTEPRSVAAKQCYSCGGIGHIQAECPTLRLQGSNQKCYVRAAV
jgi:hypothetical protein